MEMLSSLVNKSFQYFQAHMLLFWTLAIFSDLVDHRKVPDGKIVRRVLWTQVLAVFPFSVVVVVLTASAVPDALAFPWTMLGVLCGDFLVYFHHRLMHSHHFPNLRLIHLRHHSPSQIPSRSSLQSLDSAMIEALSINLVLFFLPLMIMGADIVLMSQLGMIGTTFSVLTHSNWIKGILVIPYGHDMHHQHSTTNFSNSLVPDLVFGTHWNAEKESQEKNRKKRKAMTLLATLRENGTRR
jgi:sterol desaturase/sphingolipid hydroxylase (fatty acid hydroxylase superfamily)